MFGLKLKKKKGNFTHLKLWVAVARHNFKWVKIFIIQFSRIRVNYLSLNYTQIWSIAITIQDLMELQYTVY